MTKPFITISAYPLIESGPGLIAIELGIGKNYPSRRCQIQNVADCKKILHDFAAELEVTQKPWRLVVNFDKKTGRKPKGFDKAQAMRELEKNINEHLMPARQIA